MHSDEARERILFEDPDAARRFAAAVGALVGAGDDRSDLLALHLAWLGSPDGQLRRLAVNAFLLAEPPFGARSAHVDAWIREGHVAPELAPILKERLQQAEAMVHDLGGPEAVTARQKKRRPQPDE